MATIRANLTCLDEGGKMSWYFIFKCITSGIVVALVSEIAKRSPGFAAIVASLPLTSILALVWLYRDTGDAKAVTDLSNGIALVVLPSLVFFVLLSGLLRYGWGFWVSLGSSSAVMALVYFGYVGILERFGIKV
jgi:hypothetical protein